MKRIFLIAVWLCVSLVGLAQNFHGTVVSKSNDKPIDGVSVCLLSPDSTIVSFGISDLDGKFSIEHQESQKKVAFLSFQCMGFKRLMLPVDGLEGNLLIRMEDKTFRIKEVKVTSKRIVEKEDTLVYSVAGFAQPQDRSIADVIAKMPGLEVNGGGQISFNGKAINKFYIEGMDLMGDKYALASNNLSRKRIKSVEVLQNHQPIAMLRGKSFSEQAALNLILEDNSKMNLTGSADLGAGGSEEDFLYKNRLLAMSFGRKYQTLNIYKNDNTGADLYTEISPMNVLFERREEVQEEGSLVSAVSTAVPDIDRTRYTFNKSHLVATNHLFQLAKKATLRAQVSYFDDVSERSNRVETEYLFDENQSEKMVELNLGKSHKKRLDANLNLEINRKELYVKNELKGSFEWLTADSRTQWNDASLNLSSTPDRRFFADELDVKLPLSNDRFISITSSNGYNKMPQELSIYSGELQAVDYTSFYTHTTASFRHKFFKLFANYKAGFKGQFQELDASIAGKSLLADQRLNRCIPYGGLELMYERNSFRAEGNVDVQWLDWNWKRYGTAQDVNYLQERIEDGRRNVGSETSDSEGRFYPKAQLKLRYQFNGYAEMNMKYGYEAELEDLRQIYDGYLFTSYRTMVNNAHAPEVNESHRVSVFYKYNQPIKGLFFSLSASARFSQEHSAYETELSKEHNLLVRNRIAVDYDSKTYMVNARFTKSFSWWKSLFALNGGYLNLQDAQFTGGQLQDFYMNNYSASASFSARPLRFLSVELKSSWSQQHLDSPTADSKVNQWRHHVDLSFPITDNLLLGINNAIHQSVETHENSWFSDFYANYTYKRVEFQLKVNNILGKSAYEREFVSSIERNYYRYTLRPREFIAGLSFNF